MDNAGGDPTWTSSVILFILASLCMTSVSSNCPDVCQCVNSIVHCAGEHVTSVPSGIPTDTTELFISNTSLDKLDGGSFRNLTYLRKLSLSFNKIRKILPGAFEGLCNLTELCLNNNQLQLTNDVYFPDIFRYISKLRVLHLHANSDVRISKNYSYPDASWALLPMLRELTIDGLFEKQFPFGFSKLINLAHFSTSGKDGHCNIQVLRNSTFVHFRQIQLRYLDISHCSIHTVEPSTFKHLAGIHTINLEYQVLPAPYHDMTNVFHGLERSAIRKLIMNHMCRTGSHVITADTFKPLQNTNLQTLELNHNGFVGFESGFSSGLPRSLEHVELNENYIINIGMTFDDLLYMYSSSLTYMSASLMVFHDQWNEHLTFLLPTKWETILLSSMHVDVTIPNMTFGAENSVRKLQLRDGTLQEYRSHFKGLNILEEFTFSNMNCRYLSTECFKYMPSLKLLDLSNNDLGDVFSNDNSVEYFRHIAKLEILDLSQNAIRYMPEFMFMNLRNLKYLRLRNNAMNAVNASLVHMRNLRILDLAHNSIKTFGEQFIKDLDIIMTNSNLSIDLSYNELICSCKTLSFLTWLHKKRHQFVSLSSYKCLYMANNTRVSLRHFDMLIDSLDAECREFDVMIPVASVALVLFMFVAFYGIIYRHRLDLLYWIHVVKRSRKLLRVSEKKDFEYDAFVSCAEARVHFVTAMLLPVFEEKYGLKLCLECRDFDLAGDIAENITDAIHYSRKTVIMLDDEYINCELSMFEFRMARMENVYSGRDTMIVVVYPCVRDCLTLEILVAMRSQTFLYFPENEEDLATFWDRLRSAITVEHV